MYSPSIPPSRSYTDTPIRLVDGSDSSRSLTAHPYDSRRASRAAPLHEPDDVTVSLKQQHPAE